MNIIFIAVLLYIGLFASPVVLQNQYVKTSVSENGTFGNGMDFPGMQFDETGTGTFDKKTDYLQPGRPYEFFSLLVDGNYYCNNNEKIRETCKQIDVKLTNITDNSLTVTAKIHGLQINQTYKIPKDRSYIIVDVILQNISADNIVDIYYARGIDPDADNGRGAADTINSRGYTFGRNKFNPTDVIYSVSKKTQHPLGIYTNSQVKHNTSLLKPNWRMDPSAIIQGLEELDGDSINGDQTINIAFWIDKLQPKEKHSFLFAYIFGENLPEIMTEVTRDLPQNAKVSTSIASDIVVPYRNTTSYELVETLQVRATNEDNKTKKRLVNFIVDDIPQGILVQIGDNNLTSVTTKTSKPIWIYFDSNDTNVSLFRNKEYNKARKSEINLRVEDVNDSLSAWIQDEIIIPIQPQERNISIVTEGITPKIPLNKIDELNEIIIKLEDNGSALTKDEFLESDLDIEIHGLNFILEKDEEHLNYILKLKPEIPLCLTAVGDVKVHLEIDDGYYPGDYGSLDFVITIEDVSWWEKCKNTIFTVLAALFTIWYVLGMIKKNRFSKSIRLERYDYNMLEQEYNETHINYYLRQRRGILWALIPYIHEKENVSGITFIATRRKSSVRIDRHSLLDSHGKPLEGIKINGVSISNSPPGKYGKVIDVGSTIYIGEDKRYELKN